MRWVDFFVFGTNKKEGPHDEFETRFCAFYVHVDFSVLKEFIELSDCYEKCRTFEFEF